MNEKPQLETREKPLEFSTQEGEQSPPLVTTTTNGGWEQKCWGKTQLMFRSKEVSLHRLVVDVPNSFCSIHYHANRDNRFTVLSGSIKVVVREAGVEVPHIIQRGHTLMVPAGLIHQFQATTNRCIFLECYTSHDGISPVEISDIVRQHEGGVDGQPVSPGSLFLVKK